MSLDIWLTAIRPIQVFESNITHNLGPMAKEAGLYEALWRPDEIWAAHAGYLVPKLKEGLALLKAEPARFIPLSPKNGWGTYDGLVKFVEEYLAACEAHPDAEIGVSR